MPENKEKTLPQEETQLGDDALELEGQGGHEGGDDDFQGEDPFDKIEDETVRAEAKKFRSIANRKSKQPKVEKKPEEVTPPKAPEMVPTPGSEFLTKKDFQLSNQKTAISRITTATEFDSDSVKDFKNDLAENWDEVIKNYTPRRGKDSPESIMEDIKDAYVLFSARKTQKETKPDTTELSSTTVLPAGQTGKVSKTAPKDPPGFKIPTPPTDWYPKKQS
jgi:hypothetical protein